MLQLPDLREFELVVDGVDSLKRLVVQFAELEPYELGTGKKKRVNIELCFALLVFSLTPIGYVWFSLGFSR